MEYISYGVYICSSFLSLLFGYTLIKLLVSYGFTIYLGNGYSFKRITYYGKNKKVSKEVIDDVKTVMTNSMGEVVNYDFVNGYTSYRNIMILYYKGKPVAFSSNLLIPEINVIHIGIVMVDEKFKRRKIQFLAKYNFAITFLIEHPINATLGNIFITSIGNNSSGCLRFTKSCNSTTVYPNPFVHNIKSVPPFEYLKIVDYILNHNRKDFLISDSAYRENFIIRKSNSTQDNIIFSKFINDRKTINNKVIDFFEKLKLDDVDEIIMVGKFTFLY